MTDYPTEPADVLEAAANLLESKGWGQGEFMNAIDPDDATKFCAVGAIRTVTGYSLAGRRDEDYAVYRKRYACSLQANVALGDKVGTDVVHWNDQPGRTAEEVIDALKQTAKDIRNTH